MSDSIRMIEKLIIRDAFDAEPSFVLRVIRIPSDPCNLSVLLMNQGATPGHATLANRPDDFLFHASPPGTNSGHHNILFLRVFQSNLNLALPQFLLLFEQDLATPFLSTFVFGRSARESFYRP